MSMPLLFVLLAFAVHRVTRFILDDRLIQNPRRMLLLRLQVPTRDNVPRWEMWTRLKLVELFGCFWCMSIWIAGASVLVYTLLWGLPLPVLWWLAVSSAATVIANYTDGEVAVAVRQSKTEE